MKNLLFGVCLFIISPSIFAAQGWFCEQAASERMDNRITSCGIGYGKTESAARKDALDSAYEELDSICERSVDCKNQETVIEPQRNDCRYEKKKKRYKCYRAVDAIITKVKRKKPFKKKETFKEEKKKEKESLAVDVNVIIEQKGDKVIAGCPYKVEKAVTLRSQLKKKFDRKAFVKEAIKVPYTKACIKFHIDTMYILRRAKVKIKEYNDFVIKKVQKIPLPSYDVMTRDIFDLMESYAPISNAEWNSLYVVVKNANHYSIGMMLRKLLYSGEKSKKDQKKKIDTIFSDVKKEKIGRPTPINKEGILYQVIRATSPDTRGRDAQLALYTMNKYGKGLKLNKPRNLTRLLKSVYSKSDYKERKSINEFYIHILKNHEPTAHEGDDVMDRLSSMLRKSKDDKLTKDERAEHRKLRASFLKGLGKDIDKYLDAFSKDDKRHKLKRVREFCVKQDLRCKGLLYSASEFKKILSSSDAKERVKVIKLIAMNESYVYKYEDQLIQSLRDVVSSKLKKGRYVISEALKALNTVDLKNKKNIRVLSRLCIKTNYSCHALMEKQGRKFLPNIIEELEKPVGKHHLQSVRLLRQLSFKPEEARAVLEKIVKNKDRKYSLATREAAAMLRGMESVSIDD